MIDEMKKKKRSRKLFKRERRRIFAFNVSCLRKPRAAGIVYYITKNKKTKVYKVTFQKTKQKIMNKKFTVSKRQHAEREKERTK